MDIKNLTGGQGGIGEEKNYTIMLLEIVYYEANPILGALAAAALSFVVSSASKAIQNSYNSPKAQKRRLQKAGLPLSYMYQGNVATQDDSVDFSIDPDFGVVETRQLQETTRMNDKQIEKLEEEIDNIDLEGDILRSERNIQLHKEDFELSLEKGYKDKTGKAITPQERRLRLEIGVKQADKFFKEHSAELKRIDSLFREAQNKADLARISQQIANMISQNKVLNQLYDIRKVEQAVNRVIGGALEDGEPGLVALYGMLLKLFSKL